LDEHGTQARYHRRISFWLHRMAQLTHPSNNRRRGPRSARGLAPRALRLCALGTIRRGCPAAQLHRSTATGRTPQVKGATSALRRSPSPEEEPPYERPQQHQTAIALTMTTGCGPTGTTWPYHAPGKLGRHDQRYRQGLPFRAPSAMACSPGQLPGSCGRASTMDIENRDAKTAIEPTTSV
jgi:hypothetical protein